MRLNNKLERKTVLIVTAVIVLAFISLLQQVNYTNITATGKNVVVKRTINDETIKVLKGLALGNVLTARREVLEVTLHNLNSMQWLDNEALNFNIAFADVYSTEGDELIVQISLGKDKGILVVFAASDEGYKMAAALTDLAPIEHVDFIQLPGISKKAIVVDEYLDEMTGGFYKVKTKSIFMCNGKSLEKFWQRETLREEYFPEGLQLKGNKTQWMMKKEKVNIEIKDGSIQIRGKAEWGESRVLGNIHGDYKITLVERIIEKYIWDQEIKQFKKHAINGIIN